MNPMRHPDESAPTPAPRPQPMEPPHRAASRPLHLLMVARDFPPANSSAALRALSLTEQLAEQGWRTTVVSVRAQRHAWTDQGLAERVPPTCAVRLAFGFDTKATLSLWGRYPRLLAFPDRDVSWLLPAVRHAVRAHRSEPIAALLSSSPPVTAHCIAGLLHRATGAPWIAELRDPWNLTAPPGLLSTRADRLLERWVYTRADRIVVTTDGLADELRRRGGSVAAKIRVVRNGFDEADFASLATRSPPQSGFTILHAGACLPPYRDPRCFLAALRLCLERGDLPPETRVVFLGAGDALHASLRGWVSAMGLDGRVHIGGRIPHRQAIASMLRASLLLLLQDWEAHRTSIPQKAYEYLRSGRPVLAIAPATSDTAALVRGCPGVMLASPTDSGKVAEQLAAAYRTWCVDPQRTFDRAVAGYESRGLAARMLRVIEEIRRDPSTRRRGA
jgi:glycosyltransferase involved in cell wall biosynthesis